MWLSRESAVDGHRHRHRIEPYQGKEGGKRGREERIKDRDDINYISVRRIYMRGEGDSASTCSCLLSPKLSPEHTRVVLE